MLLFLKVSNFLYNLSVFILKSIIILYLTTWRKPLGNEYKRTAANLVPDGATPAASSTMKYSSLEDMQVLYYLFRLKLHE